MESSQLKAKHRKQKRVLRIRKKIIGTNSRPRVCVTKTNTQMFIQFIDDSTGKTLVSLSTLNKEHKLPSNNEGATKLGELLAAKCSEAGIKSAVLDRRGNRYHGQIAALTDAMRNNGIEI